MNFLQNLYLTFKSLVKIILLSRPLIRPHRCAKGGNAIAVLANGPSLADSIAHHADTLRRMPTVAVNFMAATPQFEQLRPDYYVLADPFFFNGQGHDNIDALWQSLRYCAHPMTLCVPAPKAAQARRLLAGGTGKVSVATYNYIGAQGFAWFENWAYRHRLAMPRPRNVLMPAIMCAIAASYREIYVLGADHSWLETLRVADDNTVVSVQPHFYEDSRKELDRIAVHYRSIRLHQLLDSFRIAFASYHTLQRWAAHAGIAIYNSTPGSYIDALPRRPLP